MKILMIDKNGLEFVNVNRRKAIHERCINCSGGHPKDVTDCKFTQCPLYPFRTGHGKQDAKLRTKAIKEYCLWCANGQVGEVTKCPSKNCPLYLYRKGSLEKTINTTSFEKFNHIGDDFKINVPETIEQHRFRKSA